MFGRHTNTILAPLESYVDSNTFINRANKWKQLSAEREIGVLNNNKKGYCEGRNLKQIRRNFYLVNIVKNHTRDMLLS